MEGVIEFYPIFQYGESNVVDALFWVHRQIVSTDVFRHDVKSLLQSRRVDTGKITLDLRKRLYLNTELLYRHRRSAEPEEKSSETIDRLKSIKKLLLFLRQCKCCHFQAQSF